MFFLFYFRPSLKLGNGNGKKRLETGKKRGRKSRKQKFFPLLAGNGKKCMD
jgi:hypothetical protein